MGFSIDRKSNRWFFSNFTFFFFQFFPIPRIPRIEKETDIVVGDRLTDRRVRLRERGREGDGGR